MQAEIEQLSRHRQLSVRLMNALARGEITDRIVQALQQGSPLEKIVDDLDMMSQSHTAPPLQHLYQQFDARSALHNSIEAKTPMEYLPKTASSDIDMLPNRPQLFGGLI